MRNKFLLGIMVLAVMATAGLLLTLGPETDVRAQVACPWNPGDPVKMHFPQLPDEQGYDVNATYPASAADDWQCTESGPVKEIHFWGSWRNGNTGVINRIDARIYSDVPAGQSPTGYSMPGDQLWNRRGLPFEVVAFDPPTPEHWYDPAVPETLFNDHQAYFRYDVCVPEEFWFYQEAGTIYWLELTVYVDDAQATHWGWKTSTEHFNDDAVWIDNTISQWMELIEPTPTLHDAFSGTWDYRQNFHGGGSSTAYGDGWYEYEEWWNIWFYDHPFDYDRMKNMHISISAEKDDWARPSYLVVAANWSTDLWSLQEPPPDHPPLPPTDESAYIGRAVLDSFDIYSSEVRTYTLQIPDYNPEWVSVDVRGENVHINPVSFIEHQCTKSLDLAFVIVGGEDLGACCYDDPTGAGPTCAVMSESDCVALGGTWLGVDTECSNVQACCMQDGQCFDVDSVCCEDVFGGEPQGTGTTCSPPEACCMPDGSCQMMDQLCCLAIGGDPQGAGLTCAAAPEACCLPDGSCAMMDPLCCMVQGGAPQGQGSGCWGWWACCLPDGSCQMMDGICCDALGGIPGDIGSECALELEACCLPSGECAMMDPLCCGFEGGSPQGPGTACTELVACCLWDGTCQMLDPLCCVAKQGEPVFGGGPCTETRACCLSDNTCDDLDPLCCLALGGEPVFESLCLGDLNEDGTDDACESQYCCGMYDPDNRTGNVDQDASNVKDLTDILLLANYAFLGGDPPPCLADMNVSGDLDCVYDLTDVLALANYAYLSGPLPAYCLPECEE